MRIGMIAPPWLTVPPQGYGGTEAVVAELVIALQAAGHDVLLAAASDSTAPVPRVAGTAASDPERISADLPEIRHVAIAYRAFDHADVDIVHDHTMIGPLYLHRGHTPVVTTAHGLFDAEATDIYRAMAGETAIVAISHRQAETADGFPIRRVIHHGVDPDRISVGPGGDYACFVGRMDPTKGIVEAIRIARRAGIPLQIAAKVRSVREKQYFDDVVRPELGPDTVFMGEIDSAAKQALLGGALALLDPIHWEEPFGMVMIEALMVGTPVIATRMGSAPEIVRDGITGFLCANEDDFVAALDDVRHLGRAACRSDAETRFSAARMAADYLQLFGEMTLTSD